MTDSQRMEYDRRWRAASRQYGMNEARQVALVEMIEEAARALEVAMRDIPVVVPVRTAELTLLLAAKSAQRSWT